MLIVSNIYKTDYSSFRIEAPFGGSWGMQIGFSVYNDLIIPDNYGQSNITNFVLRGELDFRSDTKITGVCSPPNLDCVSISEFTITKYTSTIGTDAKGSFEGTVNIDSYSPGSSGSPTTHHTDVPFSCEFSLPLEEL